MEAIYTLMAGFLMVAVFTMGMNAAQAVYEWATEDWRQRRAEKAIQKWCRKE